MAIQDSLSHIQAVRRVYESDNLSTGTSTTEVFHVACHPDGSGKGIILWDDILVAFKDAVHVRSGTMILPFLKGLDFKNLDPLRIAAIPGATLDVVVKAQLARSESGSQHQLSLDSPQPSTLITRQDTITSTASTRRNPAYGLENEAMENYTHMEKPATAPPRRGLQTIPDDEPYINNTYTPVPDIPSSGSSNSSKSRPRAPQEYTSTLSEIFAETIAKARLGDKDAQAGLGDMYRDGRGVRQDYPAAMEWYIAAAEQGHADALYNIGFFHNMGHGTSQDFSEAMIWYLRAAELGHADAQYEIGHLYHRGQGVSQDYPQAMNWYLMAAHKDHAGAQIEIGFMYKHGQGVAQDYSQAKHWYGRAAEQGDAFARFNLGVLSELGQSWFEEKLKPPAKVFKTTTVDQRNTRPVTKPAEGRITSEVNKPVEGLDAAGPQKSTVDSQVQQQDENIQVVSKKKRGFLSRIFK
ncbi:hypothetical protein BGW39_011456 [Mortierella sp. 14UC]|nr:hypothetical protein BGW39_011456 [Mortierella sp. 14UC]